MFLVSMEICATLVLHVEHYSATYLPSNAPVLIYWGLLLQIRMSSVLQLDESIAFSTESTRLGQRMFIICDDCYWCASSLSTAKLELVNCPQCNRRLSELPLSIDETYEVNFNPTRGVEIEFATVVNRGGQVYEPR